MPIVWFYEDDSGGWTYLSLRLGMSDLKMEDTGSSPCHICTLSHVRELAGTLSGDDVDLSSIPTAPLSFTELLMKLIRMGILDHP